MAKKERNTHPLSAQVSSAERVSRVVPDAQVSASMGQSKRGTCSATVPKKVEPPPVVRCAIYTRHCPAIGEPVWKSHQEQRDACKALVTSQRQHGWRALRTRYIDSGSSRPTMERASIRRLLEHVQKGMIDVVAVYRLEHLSEKLVELAKIIEVFYEHKVSLASASQQIQTNEPAGRLAVGLLLSFANLESKLNSETQVKSTPVTPPRLPVGSREPEYERFIKKSQSRSEVRQTIRTRFLILGPQRNKAFLGWARKGFRFRKPPASQPMPENP